LFGIEWGRGDGAANGISRKKRKSGGKGERRHGNSFSDQHPSRYEKGEQCTRPQNDFGRCQEFPRIE
jgi:hypothetical protein